MVLTGAVVQSMSSCEEQTSQMSPPIPEQSGLTDDSDYDADDSFQTRRSPDKPFLCGVVEG